MGERFKEGVRRIAHGPKGYKRSDERIREDVCERIARSGLEADDVEVRVESAEVTLTGTVRDRQTKRQLEDVVEDVFGVDEVNNHLRLRREEAQASTTGTTEHGEALHH
jgi:osmotically-inducible protein OsmY